MDRYLYKAKRLDWRKFPEKGQWIIGYYVLGFNEYEQPVHLIFEPTSMFFSHGETDGWTEIDRSTLCRCTGLKDKNDKLIWEGDIVKINNSKINTLITFRDFEIICTIPGGKYYKHRLEYDMEYEVIGNIFDNPELLESEEQYDRK